MILFSPTIMVGPRLGEPFAYTTTLIDSTTSHSYSSKSSQALVVIKRTKLSPTTHGFQDTISRGV